MYLKTRIKAECCGCSACEQICPKSCISMENDEEGFLYPTVKDRDRCIDCGLCAKVCPNDSPSIDNENKHENHCYFGWNRCDSIRRASTSGAAFYSIARFCLENGYTKVYGAELREDFSASHKAVSSIEQLEDLVGSKYIQSNTQSSFGEVLSDLKSGEKVVFSGTPCQIDGLLHFIPVRYRKDLLTVSLICHATACPKVFQRYVEELGTKKRVVGFKFRDKQIKNGVLSQKYTTIKYEDGSCVSHLQDPFVVAFGQGLFTRESCMECKYTTPNRLFDITIGDFWGLLLYRPELSDEVEKGISLMISHSEKGQAILHEMESMHLEEVPVAYAVNPIQQQLMKPLEKNPFRYGFLTSRSKRNLVIRIKTAIVMYKVYFILLRCCRKAKRMVHLYIGKERMENERI